VPWPPGEGLRRRKPVEKSTEARTRRLPPHRPVSRNRAGRRAASRRWRRPSGVRRPRASSRPPPASDSPATRPRLGRARNRSSGKSVPVPRPEPPNPLRTFLRTVPDEGADGHPRMMSPKSMISPKVGLEFSSRNTSARATIPAWCQPRLLVGTRFRLPLSHETTPSPARPAGVRHARPSPESSRPSLSFLRDFLDVTAGLVDRRRLRRRRRPFSSWRPLLRRPDLKAAARRGGWPSTTNRMVGDGAPSSGTMPQLVWRSDGYCLGCGLHLAWPATSGSPPSGPPWPSPPPVNRPSWPGWPPGACPLVGISPGKAPSSSGPALTGAQAAQWASSTRFVPPGGLEQPVRRVFAHSTPQSAQQRRLQAHRHLGARKPTTPSPWPTSLDTQARCWPRRARPARLQEAIDLFPSGGRPRSLRWFPVRDGARAPAEIGGRPERPPPLRIAVRLLRQTRTGLERVMSTSTGVRTHLRLLRGERFGKMTPVEETQMTCHR